MKTVTVTLYSKPGCVQCDATLRVLDDHHISYQVVDLSTNERALQHVKKLGHLAAPVVEHGRSSFSGFRPDLIAELADTLGLA